MCVMKISVKYVFVLQILILLMSCEPEYYKPNRVNAPLLSDAGQVAFCVAPNNTQVAFSPTKNLGLIGGYSRYANNDDSGFGRERVNLFEVGAGYYGHIDTNRHDNGSGWIYDIYGGYGFGRINVTNRPPNKFPSMNVSRIFIQPGIGIRTKIIECSFNWRLCNVHYSGFNYPASIKTPADEGNYIFSEPAVTFRVGYKPVKLEVQFVHSMPFSNIVWNRSQASLNVGINAIIGAYKKSPK